MLPAALIFLLPLFFLFFKNSLFGAKSHFPPGPSAWQLLANISEIRKKPHVSFANLSKVYGPIMSLRLGSQLLVIASTSEAAKEILKTQDKILSGRYLPALYYSVPQAPDSSLTICKECNDTWKFLRGMGQNNVFSTKSIGLKANIRAGKLREVVKYLRRKQGEVVKLEDVIQAFVINIISNILVSRDLCDIKGEVETDEKFVKAVYLNELVQMVSSPGLSDFFPVLRGVDFWSKRRGGEIYEKVKLVWGHIIKERRASPHGNNAISARDYLDVLIENNLSDDQIYIALLELMLGGIDTTTITTAWLMLELIRHPEILQKVRDEISKAFEGDMLINESVLTESQYLLACIKETLRLHNPVALLLPHRAIETCKVNDYVIPKDSVVLVNTWAFHLEPEKWEDARSFKPERFLKSEIDFRSADFKFIPFSAGRRMCPGLNVALKNVQVMVASLVHYFDWIPPNGIDPREIDMSERFGTVIRKEKPSYLIPRLRK